jgi:hypothetical protein
MHDNMRPSVGDLHESSDQNTVAAGLGEGLAERGQCGGLSVRFAFLEGADDLFSQFVFADAMTHGSV